MYVYGNNVDEVLQVRDEVNEDNYYYHTNVQGNVVAISDSAGTVREEFKYDIYGRLTAAEAWNGSSKAAVDLIDGFVDLDDYFSDSIIDNVLLFQGRRLDEESGLYYFRNRQYDPVHGRFLSRDPEGYTDSYCLYQFVNNNPINYTDPSGQLIILVDPLPLLRLVGLAGEEPKPSPAPAPAPEGATARASGSSIFDTFMGALKGLNLTPHARVQIPAKPFFEMPLPFPPGAVVQGKLSFLGECVVCCKEDRSEGLLVRGSLRVEFNLGYGKVIGGGPSFEVGAKGPMPDCEDKLSLSVTFGIRGYVGVDLVVVSTGLEGVAGYKIGVYDDPSGFVFKAAVVTGKGTGAEVKVFGRAEAAIQKVIE